MRNASNFSINRITNGTKQEKLRLNNTIKVGGIKIGEINAR